MSDAQTIQEFFCTQCGGELHPEQGQMFITCPYCTSTVYLDKSQVVFHWYLAPTIDETKARMTLARWMAGNQTVKDLDKKSGLESSSFEFFPIWYFKYKTTDGQEQILLEPAAATSISELKQIKLPAGDLRKFQLDLDAHIHAPTVPLQAAQTWLQNRGINSNNIAEKALVHLPIFTFKYNYEGQVYTALVEAATGSTLANIFPAKSEKPYWIASGLSIVTFLILAFALLLGIILDGGTGRGFSIGSIICFGAGIPTAILLFIISAWVAAKI